ncbi:LPXTG cell wall anchor domain-containing protein [Kitasatospora sp. NPDC054939]
MRIRSTAARSLVAVPTAAALLLLAPTAEASQGGKSPNGNNGTVKIHDAATGEEEKENNPKVCTFYLDSFGFDKTQAVVWMITRVHDKDEEAVVHGKLNVDGKGHGRTEDISLPDGHYKLYWVSVELEKGKFPKNPDLNNPKHKVFKVDCGGPTPTVKPTPTKTPTKSPSSTPTPTKTPTKSPSATPTATPSPSATATGTPTPTGTPSPTVTVTPSATATPSVTTSPEASTSPSATVVPSPSGSPVVPPAPVEVANPGTVVDPANPLPAVVGGSGKEDLASTGSDGTLLLAGTGTALLLGGAALVYTRRTRRN